MTLLTYVDVSAEIKGAVSTSLSFDVGIVMGLGDTFGSFLSGIQDLYGISVVGCILVWNHCGRSYPIMKLISQTGRSRKGSPWVCMICGNCFHCKILLTKSTFSSTYKFLFYSVAQAF